jgi:hypothetical protein
VTIALEWPPTGDAPTLALAGMAAGTPVIVFESEESADWPALNPQTWQPRRAGPFGPAEDPIVISIDPRDEHHSLKIAMQRLSADPALRASLGAAAHEWWSTHATVDHAVRTWQSIIEEALIIEPPPVPGWLTLEDGTARAKEILADFGVTTDLF